MNKSHSFLKWLAGNIETETQGLRVHNVAIHASQHIIRTDFQEHAETFAQHSLNRRHVHHRLSQLADQTVANRGGLR